MIIFVLMDKTFCWFGPPDKAVLEALATRGWTQQNTDAGVSVSTQLKLTLAAREVSVWLVEKPVGLEALKHALACGVYAIVAKTENRWVNTLLARMEELVVPESVVSAPEQFVATSAVAQAHLRQLYRAAQTSMPVLLTGETGTGKDVAARVIHAWSSRRLKQLVPINCAAIPNELIEGELFGYLKGSFSGALRDYDGLVAAAEGGTVFLDEVDDTPHSLQVKLLRVLEDRVVSRLGENRWRAVDFRIVAATNQQLESLIERGQFGADLYQRLSTLRIEVPVLRERREDILPLSLQMLKAYYSDDVMARRRHHVESVSRDALSLLEAYHWPGNIRELRNVIAGALVAKRSGDTLLAADLPRRLWTEASASGVQERTERLIEEKMSAGQFNLKREIETLERLALTLALSRSGDNATEAARLLGQVGRGSAQNPGDTVRAMMRRLKLKSV